MDSPPTVRILLLGDPSCGKSTFLSKLSHGANSTRQKTTSLPLLHDPDQPFVWNIRMYNRAYRFEFSDTASPTPYTLLHPHLIILCYGIDDRKSLVNVQQVWYKHMVECYMRASDDVPVVLLGLKRDLRREGEGGVLPQEGVRVAQEMRCDRYAECSALTGELMNEVIEDVARVAAGTTTEGGGRSVGGCCVM